MRIPHSKSPTKKQHTLNLSDTTRSTQTTGTHFLPTIWSKY